MDDLDFSDKPVTYKQGRLAPAVTSTQVRKPKKIKTKPTLNPLLMREIEQRLEEQRLAKELQDYYGL